MLRTMLGRTAWLSPAAAPLRLSCASSTRKCAASAGEAGPAAPPRPDIKELAKRAHIRVADAEVSDYEPKINSIIEWFGQLQHVDISNVAPAMHGTQHSTPLRADEPEVCSSREALLAMAPASDKAMFRVPKTATGADGDAGTAQGPASTSASTSAPAPAAAPAATTSAPAAAQGSGAAAPSDAPGPSEAAQLEALQQMDLRVGRIVACEMHPEADSLYVEQIDVGEAEPRTIVSGLVKFVPLEQMKGRLVVVVANLKPRNMRGVKSNGMVLAASDEGHEVVEPLAPPPGAAPGERVFFADAAGAAQPQPAPAVPNTVAKKKLWEAAQPGLRTSAERVAGFGALTMMTSAGPVRVAGEALAGARIA